MMFRLVAIGVVLAVLFLIGAVRNSRRDPRLPPGPKGIPILGS
jgi:hypothetical protein